MGIFVNDHPHNIQIDGGHAGFVAFFFHEPNHFIPVSYSFLIIAAIAIDMPHHVYTHEHLLVNLVLAQFLGKLLSQFVGLVNALLIQLEHNLVATLRVVAVHIVLRLKIVFQGLDGWEKTGAVAIVERMVHRIAQVQIFLTFHIFWIICAT